jgi:hypothetical protein
MTLDEAFEMGRQMYRDQYGANPPPPLTDEQINTLRVILC